MLLRLAVVPLIYVRCIPVKFSLASVAALVHDVIHFWAFSPIFWREFDLTVIGCSCWAVVG